MNCPECVPRVPRLVSLGFEVAAVVMVALSALLLLVSHAILQPGTTQCAEASDGRDFCLATSNPGFLRPLAGALFLGGIASPGVSLLVLTSYQQRPSDRLGYAIGGAAFMIGPAVIASFVSFMGSV